MRTFPLASAAAVLAGAGPGVTVPGSRNPAAGSSAVMVISGCPTATTAPGLAWISATAPAYGTGTSTAALAVSTSTIT